MSAWQALAERDDRWWVVRVEGVGVTQGRTVREARAMAKDLVRIMADEKDPVVDVVFRVGDIDATAEAARVQRLLADAKQAQDVAGREQRDVVRRLLRSGLTGSDVAAVLGVSPQRVSQLVSH